MDVLLIVDTVGLHDLLEVTLEHTGYLNRELLDAKGFVPFRFPLALPALLDGFRRWLLLFLGHGRFLQLHVLVNPARSAGAGRLT